MNHSAKVSVVIPCYRQGKYLPGAVACLRRQTFANLEIIVVNDGSDDDTDSIARGFGSQIVYVNKPNGGLSSARNAGIERSTGDSLFFLDADDLIHEDAIDQLVRASLRSDRSSVAIMGSRAFTNEEHLEETRLPEAVDSFFPWIIKRNYPIHCYLFPSDLVRSAGMFDTRMITHEDHEFLFRLAMVHSTVRTIPLAGAYYRQHPASMSRNPVRMLTGRCQLWRSMVHNLITDRALLTQHGSLLLRQLYVARLTLAVQEPPMPREIIDQCIRLLHQHGVRMENTGGVLDWIYALTPAPSREFVDRAILNMMEMVWPDKYRQIRENRSSSVDRESQ